MLNITASICRLAVLVLLAAAFSVQRAQAQSWTVQSDSGNPVQVDHNPDGTWTVTPEGGESATYGADNAESMVNDYGISAGDFSSMQSQAGDDDNAATGDNSDSGDDSNAATPDGGDDNSSAASGDSGGGDDSTGNSGGESGGDGGGGESGGGDSGD